MKRFIVLIAACGSNATPCEPGTEQACACTGSTATGTQVCVDDGLGFSTCAGCPATPTNPTSQTCGPGIYPCGPYGYSEGSTIENFALVGQRDDNANGHIDRDDTIVELKLSDVAAGAKVLVIDVCAEWCTPCHLDQPNLNAMSQSYGAAVAFYDIMLQDASQLPGTLAAVDRWGTRLTVPYPIAADPTGITQPYFSVAGFPMHLVIRTSDMTIAFRHAGADDDLATVIDGVLANP